MMLSTIFVVVVDFVGLILVEVEISAVGIGLATTETNQHAGLVVEKDAVGEVDGVKCSESVVISSGIDDERGLIGEPGTRRRHRVPQRGPPGGGAAVVGGRGGGACGGNRHRSGSAAP